MKNPNPLLAREEDAYLALNENPETADRIVAAIEQLTAKLGALGQKAEPPSVTVEAPKIEIPAANVTVNIDTAKQWDVRVVGRDADGRIERLKFTAIE